MSNSEVLEKKKWIMTDVELKGIIYLNFSAKQKNKTAQNNTKNNQNKK